MAAACYIEQNLARAEIVNELKLSVFKQDGSKVQRTKYRPKNYKGIPVQNWQRFPGFRLSLLFTREP